jgi:hypothetical protein
MGWRYFPSEDITNSPENYWWLISCSSWYSLTLTTILWFKLVEKRGALGGFELEWKKDSADLAAENLDDCQFGFWLRKPGFCGSNCKFCQENFDLVVEK